LDGLPAYTATPGFYTPAALVSELDSITGVSVSLNPVNNDLLWDLGTSFIDTDATTLSETLGLQRGADYTGTFTTKLFLASPMNIDFICNQLTSTYNVYTGQQRQRTQPFVSVPVTSGFGSMVVYAPSSLYNIDLMGTNIGQLDFRVCDSMTGRELSELSHWSIELEITVTVAK
jgi:hypothetical protein